MVGRGEGTRSSGAKRNGVAVLCVVWCGVLLSVGGRGGWRWYRFLCLREIQNDGYKPPRHVAVFPSSRPFPPFRSFSLVLSICLLSLFLTLSFILSHFLSHPSPVLHTLAEGSTRSSNTRVHNRARPYASVREIHTYTRTRFTRTTRADRTTSPRLQKRRRTRKRRRRRKRVRVRLVDGGLFPPDAHVSPHPRAVTPGPREQPRT